MPNRIMQAICFLALLACCGLAGCSMCCGPYDYHYPTYGGKHERVDPAYGRVGSVFSDPNAPVGPASDSNLEPHPVPSSPQLPADDEEDLDDEDDLEQIEPANDLLDDDIDELPDPDDDGEVTASRTWRQRPLRSNFEWR